MKRHSLVGPLILILIGGLFLANNLKPELPMLELISKYWPFLLIGWGVLRLAEVLFWAATSKPLPASGISGGEWALVVFIFLIGSGLFVARRYGPAWPHGNITLRGVEMFGEPFDYPVSAQKAAGKTPRVVIDNLRGNVRVVGADAEEVKVSGTKTIRAFARSEADSHDKQTPLDVNVQGDQVIIRSNLERLGEGRQAKVDLEVTVPKGASIECRSRSSDFDLNDIAGRVDISSESSDVRAQNLGSDLRVEMRRGGMARVVNSKGSVELRGRGGDIDLENIEGTIMVNGSYYGELSFRNIAKPVRFESSQTTLRFEKIPGQVRLTPGNLNANNVVGPVLLTTRSKDVQLNDFSESLELHVVDRGDISLRPGKSVLSKMDVRTKSGNIDISLPALAKFEIKAQTGRGQIDNGFGAPFKVEDEEKGEVLTGSTGQGPSLSIRTDRGDIRLRKSSVAEKQATLPAPQQPLKVTTQ